MNPPEGGKVTVGPVEGGRPTVWAEMKNGKNSKALAKNIRAFMPLLYQIKKGGHTGCMVARDN